MNYGLHLHVKRLRSVTGGQVFRSLFYLLKLDFYIDYDTAIGLSDTGDEEEVNFIMDKFVYLYNRLLRDRKNK